MEKNKSKKKADLNKMFDIWGGEGEGGQYDELDDVDDGHDHLDDDGKQIHNGIADLNKMYNIWGGKKEGDMLFHFLCGVCIVDLDDLC